MITAMSNLLFRTVSEKLNQPTGIAVMASVGIHVILGLTLPSYAPVFSNEAPQTRRTVQLLELSEADLSRLPDLSVPTIPPYIYQQTPLQSPFPPLPSLPSPSAQESLPLDGTISVVPPSPSLTRPSSASTRTRTRISLNQPSTPIPTRKRTLGIPILSPSQLPPPPPLGTTNPESSSIEIEPTPSIDHLAAQLRDRNSSVLTNPHSKPPELPEPPRAKKDIALNPETDPAANPDNPTPTPQDSASESDQPVAQKPNSEQPLDPTDTEGNKVEPPPVKRRTLVVDYPQAACQKQLSGTPLYIVVVGADGKPTNLQPIRRAGDPILDQKAQETINTQRFLNRTDQPLEYQVSVQFSDEKCPKPTPPESSNQTPEGSNSPAPQPENPEAAEESNSPSSSSSNPEPSDRDPENSGQPSPSDTTSESQPKKDPPEESANPAEENPEASNPPNVVVPTL